MPCAFRVQLIREASKKFNRCVSVSLRARVCNLACTRLFFACTHLHTYTHDYILICLNPSRLEIQNLLAIGDRKQELKG
jgi:hypothetical protein